MCQLKEKDTVRETVSIVRTTEFVLWVSNPERANPSVDDQRARMELICFRRRGLGISDPKSTDSRSSFGS
jgi:hypothetical protein